jgi:hypothetical protein
LYNAGIDKIDAIYTETPDKISGLLSDISVGQVVSPDSCPKKEAAERVGEGPFSRLEASLNKRVKLVWFQSDNRSESECEGHYYRLKTKGGDCLLAGGLSPRCTVSLQEKTVLSELPWSVYSYGPVYRYLHDNPPSLLIFSPDNTRLPIVRNKAALTYFSDRIMSVGINGSIRMKFESERIQADYMVKE